MFSYGILANFIPTKSQLLGFTPWQIGMIMSLGALVHSITSFTIGTLSDRYGRKFFAVLSQPVIIASAVALIFAESIVPVLVAYCVFVIGETIPYLLCFVYASETFDSRNMGTSMAVFDSIIDLSLAIGPLIGIMVFGFSENIDYPFIVAVVPSAIFLAISFTLKKDVKRIS
jgi:MFS family permease